MGVLVAPEARSYDVNQKYSGTLREPMVRVIHLVRATEYRVSHDEPIVFRELQNVFGQFPFLAPSIFNFYVSKFERCDVGECHLNTGMCIWPSGGSFGLT